MFAAIAELKHLVKVAVIVRIVRIKATNGQKLKESMFVLIAELKDPVLMAIIVRLVRTNHISGFDASRKMPKFMRIWSILLTQPCQIFW